MKKKTPILTITLTLGLALLSASLASCSPVTPQAATQDPNQIASQAVQTFEAGITASAAANPTETPAPTDTPVPPAAPTVPAATTAPSEPTATYYIAPADQAEFVSQKPLDGAQVGMNQRFDVTWTLRNTGKTTWTKDYSLRYFSGAALGERNAYYFTKDVPSGEEIKITVDMVAPNYPARLKSNWVLANADEAAFFPVFMEVEIVDGPTVTPTPTSTNTPTPGPSPTKVIG